jgi:hypothetical protein
MRARTGSRSARPSSKTESLSESSRSPRSSAEFVLPAVADEAGLLVQGLEAAVRGRTPAAGVRAVHDVVVHQGGGVEDLERGGDRDDRLGRGLPGPFGQRVERARTARHRLPSPVAEQCPEALAAGQQVSCVPVERREVGADREEPFTLLVECPVDTRRYEVH